jgi:hypothetical protein
MEVKIKLNVFSKALATLSVGILSIIGLIILMPTMTIGILAGYIIGIVSLTITAELVDKFKQRG